MINLLLNSCRQSWRYNSDIGVSEHEQERDEDEDTDEDTTEYRSNAVCRPLSELQER
jgi:hypothetical protein